MRIHTSLTNLTPVRVASGAPIHFEHHEQKGSRLRDRAFEVRLGGSGGLNNTGLYGAGDYNGATWDEWGAFLGALFAADPDAVCGSNSYRVYDGAADFHAKTGDRFRGRVVTVEDYKGMPLPPRRVYLPADTHPRHIWKREDWNGPARCAFKAGCSAVRS